MLQHLKGSNQSIGDLLLIHPKIHAVVAVDDCVWTRSSGTFWAMRNTDGYLAADLAEVLSWYGPVTVVAMRTPTGIVWADGYAPPVEHDEDEVNKD